MHNHKDPILAELSKAYLQISELYHGNVSDCMKQCKEVHPHLSEDDCKEQYCKDSMTTQGNVQEGHTHEELVKLSTEELKELENEYSTKAKEAKGEEKDHHEKELADIRDILDSRKTESKKEVNESEVKQVTNLRDELQKQNKPAKKPAAKEVSNLAQMEAKDVLKAMKEISEKVATESVLVKNIVKKNLPITS